MEFVLTEERYEFWGFWEVLAHTEEEYREGQKDCDTHRDFLARIRWKTEDQQRQSGHHDAGEDDIVQVIDSTSPNVDNERDIWEGLVAASVIHHITFYDDLEKFPLSICHVVTEVNVCCAVCHVNL